MYALSPSVAMRRPFPFRPSVVALLVAVVCAYAELGRAAENPGEDEALDDGGAVAVPPVRTTAPSVAVPALPGDSRTRVEAEERTRQPAQWLGWERAPLLWSGNLGATWLRTDQSSSFAQSLNLNGNTYIVAPYIAQLNGGVGLQRSRVSSESGGGGESVVGSGGVSLFNQSRWPFSLAMSRSTSSAAAAAGEATATARSLGVSQRYTPEDRGFTVSANASQTSFSTSAGDESRSFSRDINYQPVLRTEMPQSFSAAATFNGNRRESLRDSAQTFSDSDVRLHHSINMVDWNGFRFDTAASARRFRLGQGVGGAGSTSLQQISTGYSWLPEDPDSRLAVSGNLSANRVAASGGGGDSLQSNAYVGTVNVTLPLAYPLTGSLGGSAFLAQSEAGNVSGQSLSGNLSYAFPVRPLGAFTYGAGVGTSASLARSTQQTGLAASLSANASQNVSRSIEYDGRGTLALALSQALAASRFTGGGLDGDSKTLMHSGTLRWAPAGAGKLQWGTGMQAQDQRTSGIGSSWSQLVRFDLTGQTALSWKENLSGSGAMDYSRQGNDSGDSSLQSQWVGTGSLMATYTNQRVWEIPRLIGRVEYRLRASPSAYGSEAGGSGLITDHILDSQLNYRIGLLQLGLQGQLQWAGGILRHSIVFSVNRAMGGAL